MEAFCRPAGRYVEPLEIIWAADRLKSFQVPVRLTMAVPTEVVNHREDDSSGRTQEDQVSPEIRLAAAVRQQGRFSNDFTKFGDVLLVIEHEFNWPADRLQVEVHRQQAGSDRLKCARAGQTSQRPTFLKANYYWMKAQDFQEVFCVPSEGIEYRQTLAVPAGTGDEAAK